MQDARDPSDINPHPSLATGRDGMGAQINGDAISLTLIVAGDSDRLPVDPGRNAAEVIAVIGQADIHEINGMGAGIVGEVEGVIQREAAIGIPVGMDDLFEQLERVGLGRCRREVYPHPEQEKEKSEKATHGSSYHFGSSVN